MGETTPRILIVEDDEDIASALSRGLAREGYDPVVAQDIASATDLAGDGCDAAIVDVMLGDQSGTDLVRRLRAGGMSAPIIILSALSGVDERADGLEAGADDYVAKPFEFSELVTRLKVQERRRLADATETLMVAGLRYDVETREVSGGNRTISLTEREGDLLAYMIRHAGHVVSRGDIFDTLWLGGGGSSENVVDVYIGYLRRKLAPLSNFGIDIRTVRGRGFMLTEVSDE
ncbi:response regulator transcription factor [Hwanghaeella sp.]|uniref:response regulator transcription factor n=1 Tax=Hwanghaeella sp. TaxID=2605943 RepID=UPI003CCB792F